MYRLAMAEVDKVLNVYPQDPDAMLLRAKLLQRSDLSSAIKLFQKAFKVHRAAVAEMNAILSTRATAENARASGDADLAERLAHDAYQRIEQTDNWRHRIGMPGPRQLWSAHCDLAEAYEAAGRIMDANKEYGKTMESRGGDQLMCIPLDHGEDGPLTRILMGIARVCTHMENYSVAISFADHFVTKHRSTCGVHKLLASTLLAMAEKTKVSGTVVTTIMEGNKLSATLDDAIAVMYKGFVYEEQWNDKNKQANGAFLQELLDKKASKSAKSKKDTNSAPSM